MGTRFIPGAANVRHRTHVATRRVRLPA